jgi:phosphatidylserine synthase
MVSGFGYPSFKQFKLDRRVRFVSLLLVVLIVVLVAVVLNATGPPTLLLAIFGTYALSAPVIWVFRRLRRHRRISA